MPDIPPDLFQLAPRNLPVTRRTRFRGDGIGVSLAAFAPPDVAALREVYAAVKALAGAWREAADRPDGAAARAAVLALDRDGLMDAAHALGRDSPPDPRVQKALHDVRGGGLTVLLGVADLMAVGAGGADLTRHALAAARDHTKMMRSCLPELDPAGYAADLVTRLHLVDSVVAGWEGRVAAPGGRAAEVCVRSAYRGPVTVCCLETAALDRVGYNLTNNATRFAADGRVTLWVFRVADGLVRWVVENALGAADRAWLDRETGGDYGVLFGGGRTRDGTGIGLANCAEIVAAAFGLEHPAAAVAGGYVGAVPAGDRYRAWFHWPVPADDGPTCDGR